MKKILLIFGILLILSENSFGQCTSCTYTYSGTGSTSFNVNSGQTLCITSNLTNPTINGGNGTICVATGVTLQWDGLSANSGWTINNYGTINTSLNGGQGTLRLNNKSGGTFNFTTTNFINFSQNSGQTMLLSNEAGGTLNALNTPLFYIGNNATVTNYGNMYVSKMENGEGQVNNYSYLKVNTEYYNHGGLINNGLIEVNNLKVTDKQLPMTNNKFIIVKTGGADIAGNLVNNGSIDIQGGNLNISKEISGTNGWIHVAAGTSTIQCGGKYFGTNLKFCDENTAGNGPDSQCANAGTYNATVDCFYTANSAFPIKVQSFKAENQKDKVKLSWFTSDALDFESFEVQKSFDAKSFETIESVNYDADKAAYSTFDLNPKYGVNYYRLKLLSKNNIVDYSKIVSESFNEFNEFVEIVNPIQNRTISVKTNIENPTVVLRDIIGREVFYVYKQTSNGFELTVQRTSPTLLVLKIGGLYESFSKRLIFK